MPDRENPLFFYSVVQTLRDYVCYDSGTRRPGTWKGYRFARRWINGFIPKAQWGDSDLEISFREALEMLGVAPENVDVIRDLLNRAAKATREEQSELLRQLDLHWHSDEDLTGRQSWGSLF